MKRMWKLSLTFVIMLASLLLVYSCGKSGGLAVGGKVIISGAGS